MKLNVTKIKLLLSILLNPIKEHTVSFIFLTMLLWIPEIFGNNLVIILRNIASGILLGNIFQSAAVIYIFCSIASIVSKKKKALGLFIIYTGHIVLYTFIFVELFLYSFFDSHINANILQMIEETNGQETSEFIQTYILTRKFLEILITTFAAIVLEFFFFHHTRKHAIFNNRIISNMALIFIVLSFGLFFYNTSFFSFSYVEDWKKSEGHRIRKSTTFYVFESVSQFLQERNSFNQCVQANENINVNQQSQSNVNIVLIIGESFIKKHSSLYGYYLKTNPKLEKLDNLFVFDDVISPINATSNSFKHFLSLASIDEEKNWSEVPLFPAVFKAIGYNVVFYSNQFVNEVNMDTYDASCGFFNHPQVAPKLFSHRNNEKYQFDGDLLAKYRMEKNNIETDSLNLIIFHLYGQHFNYKSRFPENRQFFTIDDYKNRAELSISQKQEIADYDNATLYNDSIVYEIMTMFDSTQSIVIYFADHGDEVNDYRPHVGRSRNLDIIGAPGLHSQLDIPFLIHFSPSYIETHPEDTLRARNALHRPFIIDDLPHVLLDLAGIDFELYNPKRSLINNAFDSTRKRIVQPLASSKINYDSVCTKYGPWNIGY